MPSARMVSATPSSGVASTSGSPCAANASLNTADEYSLWPPGGAGASGRAHAALGEATFWQPDEAEHARPPGSSAHKEEREFGSHAAQQTASYLLVAGHVGTKESGHRARL